MITSSDILHGEILIVVPQETDVLLLERMLRGAGYASITSTMDPGAVCELHRENRYDLILLDLQMPGVDGFEVMERLKEIEEDGYLPVLAITAQRDQKLRALRAGAKDSVNKPFDRAEVLARVHNMLEVRLLHGEAKNSGPASPQPHGPRGAPLHTLLYIEDNPANLKLVEQIIARHPDMRLLTAVNGNLGIEIARASRPEVILMDINLPDISGFKALEILRSDPATAHIPVIALSANAMPLNIESGLEAGFFRYLTKPIKINEFMETLNVAREYARQQVGQGQ